MAPSIHTPPAPEDARNLAPFDDFNGYLKSTMQFVVPLRMHVAQPDDFEGRIGSTSLSGLELIDMEADTHAVHRTQNLVRQGPHLFYKFSLVQEGSVTITQDGRAATLQPGDLAFYDTNQPYTVTFGERSVMTVVMLPQDVIEVPPASLRALTATVLRGETGVGTLAGSLLTQLAQQLRSGQTRPSRSLFRTTVNLLTALIEENMPRISVDGSHEQLLRTVDDYIEENLGDSDLDPRRIADANFISVRHLHALFKERGTTVSTVIRSKRLNRAYDDLVNPLNAGRSVATIGQSYGFNEAAHFSRTFRQQFGMPPSAVRTAALTEADNGALSGNAGAL